LLDVLDARRVQAFDDLKGWIGKKQLDSVAELFDALLFLFCRISNKFRLDLVAQQYMDPLYFARAVNMLALYSITINASPSINKPSQTWTFGSDIKRGSGMKRTPAARAL
jgi:hypothetical protein